MAINAALATDASGSGHVAVYNDTAATVTTHAATGGAALTTLTLPTSPRPTAGTVSGLAVDIVNSSARPNQVWILTSDGQVRYYTADNGTATLTHRRTFSAVVAPVGTGNYAGLAVGHRLNPPRLWVGGVAVSVGGRVAARAFDPPRQTGSDAATTYIAGGTRAATHDIYLGDLDSGAPASTGGIAYGDNALHVAVSWPARPYVLGYTGYALETPLYSVGVREQDDPNYAPERRFALASISRGIGMSPTNNSTRLYSVASDTLIEAYATGGGHRTDARLPASDITVTPNGYTTSDVAVAQLDASTEVVWALMRAGGNTHIIGYENGARATKWDISNTRLGSRAWLSMCYHDYITYGYLRLAIVDSAEVKTNQLQVVSTQNGALAPLTTTTIGNPEEPSQWNVPMISGGTPKITAGNGTNSYARRAVYVWRQGDANEFAFWGQGSGYPLSTHTTTSDDAPYTGITDPANIAGMTLDGNYLAVLSSADGKIHRYDLT